jgi:LysM repeat protein
MQRIRVSLKLLSLGLAAAVLILTEMVLPARARAAVVEPAHPAEPAQPVRLSPRGTLRKITRRLTEPFSRAHPLTRHRYTVRSGDCLFFIAQRFGTTWQKIYDQNRSIIGNDPDLILPGQELTIGGTEETHVVLVADPAPVRHVRHHADPPPAVGGACRTDGPQGAEDGMLPENYRTIFDYMVSHGYSDYAADGIAGNMWQESGGNPDAVGDGGGGLIGFTPFIDGQDGYLGDLMSQLAAVLDYNDRFGSEADINAHAASPADAASWYMYEYERPAPGPGAGLGNRIAAAEAVGAACD